MKPERKVFDPFGFFGKIPILRAGRGDFSRPFIDSFETEDEVVVTAELPGVKKENVTLKVDENGLSLKVEEKSGKETERKEHGINYREYSTRFTGHSEYVSFPAKVDASKAKATFKNGVLEVRVPKLHKSTGGRELKIG